MEDLRIQKTRKSLKQALIRLLDKKPFEKISVTDICKESNISRITFYTHYDHKYGLVQEIFNDYADMGRTMYRTKQAMSMNLIPSKSADIQNFVAFIEVVFEIIISNYHFFKHVSQEENPYLLSIQNTILLDTVEALAKKQEKSSRLKYSARQITGFLIYGLVGFISESKKEELPYQQYKDDIERLVIDLLEKAIFYE